MSRTSRSPIHAEESTQKPMTKEIKKGNPTSPSDSSESYRSSRRHAALVAKLQTAVRALEFDEPLKPSLLGAFPGVLEGAVLRFLNDVRVRGRHGRRREATSSTRPGHFMDTRDRGPDRAESERLSQEGVRARKKERDREYINRAG